MAAAVDELARAYPDRGSEGEKKGKRKLLVKQCPRTGARIEEDRGQVSGRLPAASHIASRYVLCPGREAPTRKEDINGIDSKPCH